MYVDLDEVIPEDGMSLKLFTVEVENVTAYSPIQFEQMSQSTSTSSTEVERFVLD